MVSVHDVAAYVLQKRGPMSAMKLQKLVYYCQAWHLVWADAPLFEDRIEAWANGPVVPALYDLHRGRFSISEWPQGNPNELDESQRDTVDHTIDFYGPRDAQWLSDLTHMERPWRDARNGLPDDQRGNAEITLASMSEYYSSLYQRQQ